MRPWPSRGVETPAHPELLLEGFGTGMEEPGTALLQNREEGNDWVWLLVLLGRIFWSNFFSSNIPSSRRNGSSRAQGIRECFNLWKVNSNDCSSHSLSVALVDTSLKSGLEGRFQSKFRWNEEQRSWDPSPPLSCGSSSQFVFPKAEVPFSPTSEDLSGGSRIPHAAFSQ